MRASPKARKRTPATHQELRDGILDGYTSLSRQLKKVARHILDNPYDIAHDTVAGVAMRIGVHPSTMVRFGQRFGYDGFSEMQKVFKTRHVHGFSDYRERVETLGGMRQRRPAVWPGDLKKYVQECIVLLEQLAEVVTPEQISKAISLMEEARRVYILGQGTSFSVAFYLYFALTRLQKPCHLLDGMGSFLSQQTDMIAPEDMVLAISFKPYTPEVVSLVADLGHRGIPVVSLTDGVESPLSKDSILVFDIRENSTRLYRSLIGSICLAHFLAFNFGYFQASHRDASEPG